ncbi:MAG: hypothetical protein IJ124_10460 [Clostridia bacterium]|nr:hypothetical protein [Clostridia bacterium]
MDKAENGALSEDLQSLRKTLRDLPPAENEEQAKVLSALDELMASLDKLGRTVDSMKKKTDD